MLIRPTGPSPNDILLVSDYPGREEATSGRALTGRVGKEVNRYLDGIELPHRDEVRVAKLIMHWNEDNEYTQADIDQDAEEFRRELERTNPRTVVTLGRLSARHFLGDVDLDEVHAIPWELDGGDRVVLPIYNPAAGFRSPEIQSSVAYGFRSLKEYLDGELRARRLFDDAFPKPVYIEVSDAAWLKGALTGVTKVWVDTEGFPRRPWSLQFAVQPGTAYLIRFTDTKSMEVFRSFLVGGLNRGERPKVVFHGSLHDLSIFRALRLEVNDLDFDDTQIMAYLLQLEPRGLKPNCVRHCGMRMQSFDDVMGDVSDELAKDYVISLYDIENADWEVRQQAKFEEINSTPLVDKEGNVKYDKLGNIKYRSTRVLPSVPKSRLHKSAERVLRSKTPRKLWLDQVADVHVDAYHRLGDMPEATLDHIEFDKALDYACRDADGTCRLEPELSRRVDAAGLRNVYNLEIGTYPLIDRMSHVGIKPNLATFATLSDALRVHIEELREKINRAVGKEMNANSGDQVADYLFTDLGLPPYKLTGEGRPSTNDKILEALEREFGARHPVISDIRSYRETFKLKHTFVDRIPDFVNRYPYDGRIHATFRTTTVVTGRLSASNPNILALPKHGYFAPIFQLGFEAEAGHLIGTWDQSQIELRVLAHLSQDPYMLKVFRGELRRADGKPIDLHSALAERIFGVRPEDQDDSLHRLPAKAINFGIPMGMQAQGLTVELRKNGVMVSEDDAQRWLDETLKMYKGVKQFQLNKIAEARRFGFVTCMSGRRRYIGGIRSWDNYTRGEAERFAFSTPIQEGAQTIMKTAEAFIWTDVIRPLWNEGVWIEPLVQIHDDIKLEFQEDVAPLVNDLMTTAMTQVPAHLLSVPLKTDGKYGHNWGELKKFA